MGVMLEERAGAVAQLRRGRHDVHAFDDQEPVRECVAQGIRDGIGVDRALPKSPKGVTALCSRDFKHAFGRF